jgi:hypothetical protein
VTPQELLHAEPVAKQAWSPAVSRDDNELFKSALQVLAIVCLIALFSMIAHQAFADIARLRSSTPGVTSARPWHVTCYGIWQVVRSAL